MFVFPNYSPLTYSRPKTEMLFLTPRILQVRLLRLVMPVIKTILFTGWSN